MIVFILWNNFLQTRNNFFTIIFSFAALSPPLLPFNLIYLADIHREG